MNIAVLGLGAMGLPMATWLSQSFSVIAFDVAEARVVLAQQADIECRSSAREAADGADVVLIAVRNQAQLEGLLYGDDGICAVLKPGASIILTSTVGIAAVESVAAQLDHDGIGLVDAPVSGGPLRAGRGELLVTVGATPDVYERCLPVLEAMASNLVWVGEAPGKGQCMKTVNQLLCGVHIAAAGEALALAGELGLDQEKALEALMSGAAASFMLGDRGPRAIQAYDGEIAEVTSRVDIFVKDMGIVTSAAKSVGMPVPVAAAAEQLYLQAFAQGRGADDDSSVINVVKPQRG